MIANQTSRGLRSVACQNAARWLGLLGSSIALLAACGGTIEQTDVDQQHLDNGNVGPTQTKAPAASSATATPKAPAANNATASANNSSSAASNAASTPAKTPDPEPAADDTDPPAAEDPPATTTTASADLSFNADIWPIFSSKCSPCHAGGGAGGQDIGGTDKTKALADAKSFKDAIIRDINSGAMPLGCAKPPGGGGNCVTEDQFADIQDWFDAGSPP